MSWVKLDDQYPDHPKIAAVGPLGMALHTAATCYCARYLTDGFVPAGMISKLVNLDGICRISNGVSNAVSHKDITDDLTQAGLFEIVPGGYKVHDYLAYNPSGEQVKAERAATAARQAEWRASHPPKAKRNAVTNSVTNSVTNGHVTGAPSPSPVNSPAERKAPKPKRAPPRDPNLDHPAVVAYREICRLTANHVQRDNIATQVADMDRWHTILRNWMNHGWRPDNVDGMLDSYSKNDGKEPYASEVYE